ncbi:MAG: hypothetical protein KBA14_03490 [Saprospiraceae bacterium]|nr:hypothetical protein [Saprospiraceae bacterium]
MSANREKSSSVMGLVMSVLLHGIFFAGCLALDASSMSTPVGTDDPTTTEIKQVTDQHHAANTKS